MHPATTDLNFDNTMPFFAGGGEMGTLIRAKDWSKTSLGNPKDWPGTPIKTEQGEVQQWVGTVTDIQERKQFAAALENEVQERTAEIAKKNEELQKMNKELESFAYISSHDLQEPLRKIRIFSDQIMETEAENLSREGKDRFERMQRSATRMQTLINDLLAYSRTSITERKFEHTNLNLPIEEVKNDLKEELSSRHATVEINEMCTANIIPFQFTQLMYNLISNALKFSYPDIPPHIKIMSRIVQGAELHNDKLQFDKHYCHISVADNGIGFDEQYSKRIFEVFQRLHGKAEYDGTGIGLAIVKKIVENHNGLITATSEPGKGARFDIYIPAD